MQKSNSLVNLRVNWLRYGRKGTKAKIRENRKKVYKLIFIRLFVVLITLKNHIMKYTILIKETFATFYICYKDIKGLETLESINNFSAKNNDINFIFCENIKEAKQFLKTI